MKELKIFLAVCMAVIVSVTACKKPIVDNNEDGGDSGSLTGFYWRGLYLKSLPDNTKDTLDELFIRDSVKEMFLSFDSVVHYTGLPCRQYIDARNQKTLKRNITRNILTVTSLSCDRRNGIYRADTIIFDKPVPPTLLGHFYFRIQDSGRAVLKDGRVIPVIWLRSNILPLDTNRYYGCLDTHIWETPGTEALTFGNKPTVVGVKTKFTVDRDSVTNRVIRIRASVKIYRQFIDALYYDTYIRQ
ncbi:MAG: hypothetical protein ABIM44_06315 [candidate division WOR-3 bacterium]